MYAQDDFLKRRALIIKDTISVQLENALLAEQNWFSRATPCAIGKPVSIARGRGAMRRTGSFFRWTKYRHLTYFKLIIFTKFKIIKNKIVQKKLYF